MVLLLIKLYKESIIILAIIIYNLNKAERLLKSDLLFVKDIDLLYLVIINKICSIYTKDKIV